MNTHFLVVGLGNPGPKYQSTRHNFGFLTVDHLAAQSSAPLWKEKFQGEITGFSMSDIEVTLIKPQTFMNLSGRCVSKVAQYYHIEVANIIVIHDELDLDFGTVRIKSGGGCAGHKGLLSIKQETGSADFLRIRMGIGRPIHGSCSDFVLSKFSSEETIALLEVLNNGAEAVRSLLEKGVDSAMNQFNKKNTPSKI